VCLCVCLFGWLVVLWSLEGEKEEGAGWVGWVVVGGRVELNGVEWEGHAPGLQSESPPPLPRTQPNQTQPSPAKPPVHHHDRLFNQPTNQAFELTHMPFILRSTSARISASSAASSAAVSFRANSREQGEEGDEEEDNCRRGEAC
jgi:hypothetical protein